MFSPEFIEKLLNSPGGHRADIDDIAKDDIRKWSSPPTALEILHTLDICAYGSLASGFVMQLFNMMLHEKIKLENTTYEEVVKNAHWRNKDPREVFQT